MEKKKICINLEATGSIEFDSIGTISVNRRDICEALFEALPLDATSDYIKRKTFNGTITIVLTEDPRPELLITDEDGVDITPDKEEDD